MSVEKLTAAGATLGEGPVWDSVTGTLLWVDIIAGLVHRTDPESGVTTTEATPSPVGAVALDRDGGLIASLVDGVYRHEVSGWERIVEIEPELEGNRANDSKCDPYGNYLVGTMSWAGDQPTGGLHRVRPDLTVETLRSGLIIANGLAWVGSEMWHIDTPTGSIVGFEYDPEGALGDQVGVIDVSAPGSPDGMCVDAEGCLWVAVWGSGTVRRYATDGRILAELSVPASQVTSCAFGGPDLSTLFITTATQDLSDPSSEPEAGAVFIATPGVTGVEPDRFAG